MTPKVFAICAVFFGAAALGSFGRAQYAPTPEPIRRVTPAPAAEGSAEYAPRPKSPYSPACILHPRSEFYRSDTISISYVLPKVKPGAVSAPKLIKRVDPQFPTDPRMRSWSGVVEIALLLDPSGKPQNVGVEKSYSPDFDRNAFEAVKQFQFQPALQDGKPIAVKVCVMVNFRGR